MNLQSTYFLTYLIFSYFLDSTAVVDIELNEEGKIEEEGENEKKAEGRRFKVEDKKLPRFLSFNNDVSNIRVEMVFAVPFLAIPIGGKDESGNTAVVPQVDINLKSLFATGVIVIMLFFVIPKLVKLYLPPAPSQRGLKDSEIARILRNVDDALREHNIDSTACTQKFVCYTVTNAAHRVAHGQGSSFDKILDGVLGIHWLRNLIGAQPIKEALNLSYREDNCQIYHNRCPVTKGRLYGAAGSLLDAIKKSKHGKL